MDLKELETERIPWTERAIRRLWIQAIRVVGILFLLICPISIYQSDTEAVILDLFDVSLEVVLRLEVDPTASKIRETQNNDHEPCKRKESWWWRESEC